MPRWTGLRTPNFFAIKTQTADLLQSDIWAVVSPSGSMIYVSDPELVSDLVSRRSEFPKPLHQYSISTPLMRNGAT